MREYFLGLSLSDYVILEINYSFKSKSQALIALTVTHLTRKIHVVY